MLLRTVVAFLAMPGVVAFAVPVLLGWGDATPSGWQLLGLLPLALGTLGLLACVREFYVSGKGTLAPWSPPKHLVRTGFYRYSRNPMYVSVLSDLIGWAGLFGDIVLWTYALFIAVAFQLRVVLGEEPWLERTFGEEWRVYVRTVPRWLSITHVPEPLE